ncbi:MAG: hypothetical protein ACFHWX_09795 [Bacteroidota bacterium]
MNYTEEIIHEKKLIIIRLRGDFKAGFMDKLAIKYRKKALENGYSLLWDTREGRNFVSLTETLAMMKKYRKPENRDLFLKVYTSIVASGPQYVFFKVVEQFVSNERGDFKVFKDLEQALQYHEEILSK